MYYKKQVFIRLAYTSDNATLLAFVAVRHAAAAPVGNIFLDTIHFDDTAIASAISSLIFPQVLMDFLLS